MISYLWSAPCARPPRLAVAQRCIAADAADNRNLSVDRTDSLPLAGMAESCRESRT
jgi:hypothetical protein